MPNIVNKFLLTIAGCTPGKRKTRDTIIAYLMAKEPFAVIQLAENR
jgi:hypothetical protein